MTKSRIRQRVEAALRRVERHKTVDSDVGSVGLAACELIASASGHPHESEPASVAQAVYGLSQGDLDTLRSAGVSCLHKIAGQKSELAELWQESGQGADWQSYIAHLVQRLQAVPVALPPPPKPKRRRRPKLGDVYEVADSELGFGYFQFVAKTENADVVLALNEWHNEQLDLGHLEQLFGNWTRTGYLERTWLPPGDDEGSTLLGTVDVPSEAEATIWMRIEVLASAQNPDGWAIGRDYVDPEPYGGSHSGTEFSILHPEINQGELAPWTITSVVWTMKNRTPAV